MLNLLARIVLRRLAVKGEQGTKVELGLLEQLNLADMNLHNIVSREILRA